MVNKAALFPITYVDDDGPADFETPEDLATGLEFYDAYQTSGQSSDLAYDGHGEKLRVIVWNVDLLICQVIDQTEAEWDFVITSAAMNDVPGYTEVAPVSGVVRFVAADGTVAWPGAWDDESLVTFKQCDLAPIDTLSFHRLWMKARTRYP